MNTDEKIRFVMDALRPMAEATFPYLASIVGANDPQVIEHVGTGFRCFLGGRPRLVTAAHVVHDARKFERYAISTGPERLPFTVPEGTEPILDIEGDLAIFDLSNGYHPAPGLTFLSVDQSDGDEKRRFRDYLFVHGFPGKQSRYLSFVTVRGLHTKSLPIGAMQCEHPPAGLEPFQFAIHYDAKGGAAEHPRGDTWIQPRGMSGSPVFRIGSTEGSIEDWEPKRARLVGIATHWDQDNQIIKATDVNRLLALVTTE